MGDDPGGFDLRAVVVAVPCLIVDARRHQEPLVMVEPQSLGRQTGDFRELADGEHEILSLRERPNETAVRHAHIDRLGPPARGESISDFAEFGAQERSPLAPTARVPEQRREEKVDRRRAGDGCASQVAVALAFSFLAARAFLRSALAALASAVVAVLVNRSFRRTALPESWRR